MITAVDSSVLFDVLAADPEHGQASRDAMRRCLRDGGLVACDIVWAEVSAIYPSLERAGAALDGLNVTFSAMSPTAALRAGGAWRAYRRRGGGRSRMVADFLIGAHAQESADRLLTRDRGFYRSHFRDLTIVEPG